MATPPPPQEPRDCALFADEDGQVYVGCAVCGYGEGSPGPDPWDRAADNLEEALRLWSYHRQKAHS